MEQHGLETIPMRVPQAPVDEAFNGVLEFHGNSYNNRSTWVVATSDNPKVIPGMICRGMSSRMDGILEGAAVNYSAGVTPTGRLFVQGKFKTRLLYGSHLTVPHR
jgi:hypothetical protein